MAGRTHCRWAGYRLPQRVKPASPMPPSCGQATPSFATDLFHVTHTVQAKKPPVSRDQVERLQRERARVVKLLAMLQPKVVLLKASGSKDVVTNRLAVIRCPELKHPGLFLWVVWSSKTCRRSTGAVELRGDNRDEACARSERERCQHSQCFRSPRPRLGAAPWSSARDQASAVPNVANSRAQARSDWAAS